MNVPFFCLLLFLAAAPAVAEDYEYDYGDGGGGTGGAATSGSGTSPAKAYTAQADIDKLLKLHNDERDIANQGLATKMPHLTWSAEMATFAASAVASVAVSCSNQKGTHTDKDTLKAKNYGENLYWGTPADEMTNAVRGWINEKNDYTIGNPWNKRCADGKVCGHYTPVVWDLTRQIGCAKATCQMGAHQQTVVACNYSPAGNFCGRKPFGRSATEDCCCYDLSKTNPQPPQNMCPAKFKDPCSGSTEPPAGGACKTGTLTKEGDALNGPDKAMVTKISMTVKTCSPGCDYVFTVSLPGGSGSGSGRGSACPTWNAIACKLVKKPDGSCPVVVNE